jgi:hypothetical protein
MTGGTPLFTTSLTPVRALAGALLLLMLISFVVIETFGEERHGPQFPSAQTVVVHQPAHLYHTAR